MAETLISPGTLARENDQSQITSQPVQVGAAIVGPTVKGRKNIPTLVTSYSEYAATFGTTFDSGSDQYTFLTSISAYNYFKNGGDSLLVTRVASGSFSSATSTNISGSGTTTTAFTLETLGEGVILNCSLSESSGGALISGSADNFRWEITNPSTSSGTFSLIIRRGNDKTKTKSVLETFNNVSLDPKSSNYIARIVGDQKVNLMGSGTDLYLQSTGSYPNASRFVRVSAVNAPTPDFFDNAGVAKNDYTSSIPVAASGSFTGAEGSILTGTGKYYDNISSTDTQGLKEGNYTDAFNLLANKDDFQYKIISAPGLYHSDYSTALNTLITTVENRGDAIIVMDLEAYSSTKTAAVSTAAGLDSSYVAAYWPWLQVKDPDTGQNVWVPASTLIPGMYTSSDKKAEPWFAPAGMNRGRLTNIVQAERKLSNSDRDTLYAGKVNPIGTFPGKGVVVFGNKTLQSQASALDRVNVRRLLIELKGWISQVANTLVFEQNTAATRNTFLSQVNPYLESIQQRQGLYAFKVVMDNTNNTPDVIDRNELKGAIYIQPAKTAEFIYLDFNILPTGAEFPI
jgi:phage tail sheath protein FI